MSAILALSPAIAANSQGLNGPLGLVPQAAHCQRAKKLRRNEMAKFNRGRPYHGSDKISRGRLEGATDTDYFYFFCPNCPDLEIMRILEYGEHAKEPTNKYNDICKSKAEYGFTLVFKLHCEKCGCSDFVKISNMGWQGGKHSETLGRQ